LETGLAVAEEGTDRPAPVFTAIWDEFALYYMPPMDIIAADIRSHTREEHSEADEISSN
jgi:hypothetical protein